MGDHSSSTVELRLSDQTLAIELETSTASDRPVYIVGNFNNWQSGDEMYQLQEVTPGKYRFEFDQVDQLPNPLEYKYTRGGWEFVELGNDGKQINNRVINTHSRLINDYVPHWMNEDLNYKPEFLPDIRIISEQFEIPQLIRTRRIAALLPHDYETSDKHYPVLYLQDGQNLFDDYAPFGNWAVDKKLAMMAEKGQGDIIIIAIDHAEKERIAEFTPSYRTKLGQGQGKMYVRFLADTLKPYIDKTFRTLPEREFTGIGGSSMGGLISIYAGLMYPEVYSRLMVFSPSLWVAPNIHFHAISFDEASTTKLYLYAGRAESANMVPNIERFRQALERQGVSNSLNFNIVIDPDGTHNEARWGQEFPGAIEWLFFQHD